MNEPLSIEATAELRQRIAQGLEVLDALPVRPVTHVSKAMENIRIHDGFDSRYHDEPVHKMAHWVYSLLARRFETILSLPPNS